MPQSTFSVGPDDSISVRESTEYPHDTRDYSIPNYASSSVYSRNTLGESIAPPVPHVPSSYRRRPLPKYGKATSSLAPSKISVSGLVQKMKGLETTPKQIESVEEEEEEEDHKSVVSSDATEVTEWFNIHKIPTSQSKTAEWLYKQRRISSASADAVTSISYASSGKTEWPQNESNHAEQDEGTALGQKVRSSSHSSAGPIERQQNHSSSSKRDNNTTRRKRSRGHAHTGTGFDRDHHHSSLSLRNQSTSRSEQGATLMRSQSLPSVLSLSKSRRRKRKHSRIQRFAKRLTKYMGGMPADGENMRRPKYW